MNEVSRINFPILKSRNNLVLFDVVNNFELTLFGFVEGFWWLNLVKKTRIAAIFRELGFKSEQNLSSLSH